MMLHQTVLQLGFVTIQPCIGLTRSDSPSPPIFGCPSYTSSSHIMAAAFATTLNKSSDRFVLDFLRCLLGGDYCSCAGIEASPAGSQAARQWITDWAAPPERDAETMTHTPLPSSDAKVWRPWCASIAGHWIIARLRQQLQKQQCSC